MNIKNGDLPSMPLMLTSEMVALIKSNPEQAGVASGTSKREQFAAMAMQGFCSNMEWTYEACPSGIVPAEWIANQSLTAADALLAELENSK